MMEFSEEFRFPGRLAIEPRRFASALSLKIPDRARLASVDRRTVTKTPENARCHGYLRDALRAISAAFEITQNREGAIYWFCNTPIPEFEHCITEDLVGQGKIVAVVKYVASVHSGSSG